MKFEVKMKKGLRLEARSFGHKPDESRAGLKSPVFALIPAYSRLFPLMARSFFQGSIMADNFCREGIGGLKPIQA